MEKWARIKYTPNLPLGENGERVTASQKHIELSCEAACEGMVLLKNDRNVLPIRKGTRVALFGKGVFDYVKGGGGSGDVTVPYIRNLYEGLSQYTSDISIYDKSVRFYQEYVADQYRLGIAPGMIKEPALPEDILADAAAYADTAIIAISRFSGEGWDRKVAGVDREIKCEAKDLVEQGNKIFDHGDFYLTNAEKKMVKMVKENFSSVIVVMNVGGVVDTTWFKNDDQISSVLMAWQGGIEGGLAAARILLGKVNPSGKLSDTFAARLEDYPSTEGFHEDDDYVDYTEDIYVGYRYFETIPGAKEKVNYPFGYGLSYTTFDQKMGEITESDGTLSFDVTVTNTGSVAGKDVIEVYFNPPYTNGGIEKASANLVQFEKTDILEPGASQTITVSFDLEDMASYDYKDAKGYVLEAGDYIISINKDSHNIIDSKTYTVASEIKGRNSDQAEVTNRFDFAEGEVNYLSRADGFANYADAVKAPTD